MDAANGWAGYLIHVRMVTPPGVINSKDKPHTKLSLDGTSVSSWGQGACYLAEEDTARALQQPMPVTMADTFVHRCCSCKSGLGFSQRDLPLLSASYTGGLKWQLNEHSRNSVRELRHPEVDPAGLPHRCDCEDSFYTIVHLSYIYLIYRICIVCIYLTQDFYLQS